MVRDRVEALLRLESEVWSKIKFGGTLRPFSFYSPTSSALATAPFLAATTLR